MTSLCEVVEFWVCPNHDAWEPGCTGSGELYNVCSGGGNSTNNSGGSSTSIGNSNVATAPIIMPQIDPAPCEKIKAKTNAQFMLNFNNINTPTYLNSGLETGFVEKKQYGVMQYVFIPGNPNGSSMNPPAGSVSFTHVHPNKPVTDENGTSIDGTVKMLSPADLKYLIYKCAAAAVTEGLTPQDAQAVMISNEGIFSLSITDANIDFNFIEDHWADFEKGYYDESDKILSQTSLTSIQRSEKLQEMMLNLLNNLGLSKNITLFEGITTPSPTGNILKWTQKTMSNDKRNKKVIPNPC